MLMIRCPWCGPRDETEFQYGGEAHIARPEAPDQLSDAEWANYVFMRTNTKGLFAERWMHAAGCRRWFHAVRDTATDRLVAVYKLGEPRPDLGDGALATPSGEPVIGSGNDGTKVQV